MSNRYTDTEIISREDFLRLEGLLTLARDHNAVLKQIEKAVAGIVGEQENDYGSYDGHTPDAVFGGYRAAELLSKLSIVVEDDPAEAA